MYFQLKFRNEQMKNDHIRDFIHMALDLFTELKYSFRNFVWVLVFSEVIILLIYDMPPVFYLYFPINNTLCFRNYACFL